MTFEVRLSTKDVGPKKIRDPKMDITGDWQTIENITSELSLLRRWGEIEIREAKPKTRHKEKAE